MGADRIRMGREGGRRERVGKRSAERGAEKGEGRKFRLCLLLLLLSVQREETWRSPFAPFPPSIGNLNLGPSSRAYTGTHPLGGKSSFWHVQYSPEELSSPEQPTLVGEREPATPLS